MDEHVCFALDCKTMTPSVSPFCSLHWALIPSELQTEIWGKWEELDHKARIALGRAIRHLYFLDRKGHPPPVD